jgi:molecular chaperone GrpE
MSDDTNNDPPQQQAAAAQETPAATEPAELPPPPDAQTELEELRAEHAAIKERLLRALAEMENLRRRTEREVAEAKLYGVTSFAREALSLADNLRRALDSFPQQAREGSTPQVAALLEGVELTERDFLSRLARFGIKKMEPHGGRFDPNQHEALFEIPDESQPAGTVAQVVEPGYLIGERVLRPAKVGVTRGGPKA